MFVGKGITFDSGGISLKPSAVSTGFSSNNVSLLKSIDLQNMKLMRGDMGGAAVVCSAVLGLAELNVPINLVAIAPFCENLPGPSANKPGDMLVLAVPISGQCSDATIFTAYMR